MRSSPAPGRERRQGNVRAKERRLAPDRSARARLRWLRGLIHRPFRLSWRGGPRWVWIERRQAASTPELAQLHADLRTEMLSVEDAARVLRELVEVDQRLAEAGWAALGSMPASTRRRARMQVEMLAQRCDSAPLATLAQRLRALEPAATGPAPASANRAERDALRPDEAWIEVSELGEEAYVEVVQAWAGGRPAPPAAPGPEAPEAPPPAGGLKA